MDMDLGRVTLWRGTRSVNVRHMDLTLDNISRIFKLIPSTIYLIKDGGDVLLPSTTGYIDDDDLHRCEVCGDEERSEAVPVPPARQPAFTFMTRPSTSTGHAGPPTPRPAKLFTRNILLGRVERGSLTIDGASLIVEFSLADATIPAMSEKVRRELRSDMDINALFTRSFDEIKCFIQASFNSFSRGLAFWRQNARKVVAVPQLDFEELQRRKKRRSGVTEESHITNMEELVLAAEQLPAITKALQDLGQFARANKVSTIALTDEEVASVKATFKCVICRDPMRNPVASSCCRGLIGCQVCIDQWVAHEPSCPKCRDADFVTKMFEMTGMEETVQLLKDTIRD
ncbi:uncharacterized protein LOC121648102 [Melanotaenia boesemani]|uniref:uncharacterized protein LOC121629210 n=1 Tax=Melanotaenia boesemani TaxID=1250792 RepID=UPI001C05E3AF|nr:uncharacterized protein LOC121629210 [Melanotaenia boesemani]XP_041835803.1 uncharacterized protein LOC121636387 [Melanotaenia boesemani]XP_041838376.1 uncharacterized protein LOC121638022 [Melanotaenia boesemani]XP_041853984.1 uncharacterized protein LOC121648102 [Melanotaenia boesemani]